MPNLPFISIATKLIFFTTPLFSPFQRHVQICCHLFNFCIKGGHNNHPPNKKNKPAAKQAAQDTQPAQDEALPAGDFRVLDGSILEGGGQVTH